VSMAINGSRHYPPLREAQKVVLVQIYGGQGRSTFVSRVTPKVSYRAIYIVIE